MADIAYNVKSFGAKGDGVTDDSQAFINAIAYAESKSVSDTSGGNSNNRGNIVIYIPAGTYVIKSSEALMRSTFTTRTAGLIIKGAGKFVTEIQFNPTTTNSYLLNNNDAWLHLSISDISFVCNDSTSNFMKSVSSGGAQNYTFERCVWLGSWNYGFYLDGGNNNSEFTWYHCNFNGAWNKGVYVPATGSDQFLNYNFFAVNFEVSQGDFLHFEKGGNINIWGGSYIHYGANGGTFFKLYGNAHSYGVQRFLCTGARMEHRVSTSVLIDSQWNDGSISFISVDTSAESFVSGSGTWITAKFTSGNQKMPVIKFDGCMLMGTHQFAYSTSSWNYPHNVAYENCEMSVGKPSDFIVYSGGSNVGGKPTIKFRNCRGISNSQSDLWDSDFNFQTTTIGLTTKKIVSLKTPAGTLPTPAYGNQTVKLPLNAIVTNVILYSPSGAVTSGVSSNFTVQTGEATPTVLGTVNFNPYSAGFNYSNPQFFVCNSDTKRTISLVPGSAIDQINGSGYCLIEYIG
jgi:hypothetical protein